MPIEDWLCLLSSAYRAFGRWPSRRNWARRWQQLQYFPHQQCHNSQCSNEDRGPCVGVRRNGHPGRDLWWLSGTVARGTSACTIGHWSGEPATGDTPELIHAQSLLLVCFSLCHKRWPACLFELPEGASNLTKIWLTQMLSVNSCKRFSQD